MANQAKILKKRHNTKLSKLTPPVRKGTKAQHSKITTSFNRNGSMVS